MSEQMDTLAQQPWLRHSAGEAIRQDGPLDRSRDVIASLSRVLDRLGRCIWNEVPSTDEPSVRRYLNSWGLSEEDIVALRARCTNPSNAESKSERTIES